MIPFGLPWDLRGCRGIWASRISIRDLGLEDPWDPVAVLWDPVALPRDPRGASWTQLASWDRRDRRGGLAKFLPRPGITF